jgi:class 3 adenylate cyclase
VVGRFETIAYDVVSSHGGRVVKMIGDEVMFTTDSVRTGAELALARRDLSQRRGDVRCAWGWPAVPCSAQRGPVRPRGQPRQPHREHRLPGAWWCPRHPPDPRDRRRLRVQDHPPALPQGHRAGAPVDHAPR